MSDNELYFWMAFIAGIVVVILGITIQVDGKTAFVCRHGVGDD